MSDFGLRSVFKQSQEWSRVVKKLSNIVKHSQTLARMDVGARMAEKKISDFGLGKEEISDYELRI